MPITHIKQRGLSLISLMVAMTIGLFLLAGLFDIWMQTRQSFTAQGKLAQLQDNERMALTMLSNSLQAAGFYPIADNYAATLPSPLLTLTGVFPATSPFTTAGQFIYGQASASSGASDTLVVRYVSDGTTLDCQGQAEPDQYLVVNTYTVTNNYLTCQVQTAQPNTITLTNNGTQNLISGVSLFTTQYGLDINNQGSVQRYATAAGAAPYWANVRSVRVQLTFLNPMSGAGQPTTLPPVSRTVMVNQASLL